MSWNDRCSLSELDGKKLVGVTGLSVGSDEVHFHCEDGTHYRMYHFQDCCESVSIDEIDGPDDLNGATVYSAEERNCDDGPSPSGYTDDCYTWTYYVINTDRGAVHIKWYGTSNGYYSESVDFEKVP